MGGVGGILAFMYLAYTRGCYAAATSLGMGGVGGILTFMYLAYTRGCYAAATSLGMGGVGGLLTCMYLAYTRGCYAAATSLGMGGVGGILTCMYLAYTRGCYAAATSLGMGGVGGILTFMYFAYTRGCYAAATSLDKVSAMWARANSWNTWKTCCRRIDAIRWREEEASACIDKVVTSFQKSMKIIVSLRRKHHFANFPMEFSHGMCTHLRLEKSPSKRIENQCWMILNPHFGHGRLCAGFRSLAVWGFMILWTLKNIKPWKIQLLEDTENIFKITIIANNCYQISFALGFIFILHLGKYTLISCPIIHNIVFSITECSCIFL